MRSNDGRSAASVRESAATPGWAASVFARSLALSGPASSDGPKPLKRSQRPNAISKITIGESNQYALTTVSKWGKTMKAKAQITHHADEITPKAANALGIYLDLSHRSVSYTHLTLPTNREG